jgi:DNA-directed RNA polymerase subunit RPC12/RpoP
MATCLRVTWKDRDTRPLFPADPDFPDGTHLDLAFGAEAACWTDLPYPVVTVGAHQVECPTCGLRLLCGANGRPDDPRTVKVPCRQAA